MTQAEFDIMCDNKFGFLTSAYGFNPQSSYTDYGGYLISKRFEGNPLTIRIHWDGLETIGEIMLHQLDLFEEPFGENFISYLIDRKRTPSFKPKDKSIDADFEWLAEVLKLKAADWLAAQRITA